MTILDIDKLAAAISADNPCGDDLEYDADFMELERVARGKPEQQMGDVRKEAEPPDWSDVESRAKALLGRAKDLRVAVHLTRAALVRHGVAGLGDGLKLISTLLAQHWDAVHPRLDPDDGDATLRANSLLPLADPAGFVAFVRTAPLVEHPLLGRFCLRDYQIATGELPRPEGEAGKGPDVAQIEGAFHEADLDALKATNAAVETAVASAAATLSAITDKVGAVNAPDLKALQTVLGAIQKLVGEQLGKRGVAVAAEAGAAAAAPGQAQRAAAPGEIASRDDVVTAIDRICDYYKRAEPSSPVPLVLRRAQRLVKMEFLEILRDMTPSGVAEAEQLGGIRTE